MTHLTERLDEIRAEGRAALIGYLPVGYPTVERSLRAMEAMIEGGVDIVEVGVPYSDPVMDGATIQLAAEQAIEAGVRVRDSFAAVRACVAAGAPAVVMSYANPLVQYGWERFADDLVAAGGSGIITPDLTPDSAEEWIAVAQERGLDRIFLTALTTTAERMHLTANAATGFVYAAALMGVTGERTAIGGGVEQLVARTREAGARRVCVGLGVSTGAQAAEVARYADGVIVGSALVRCLTEHEDFERALDALRDKAAELARGVRGQS